MSAYDIFLILLGLFGSLTIISILSAILNEGSARATAMLIALTAGFYFLADRSSEEAVSFDAISASISKLVALLIN
jgi:hypothetical protein